MNEELDSGLVQRFPKMFKNRYANPDETCMCWGFAHGDGWYNIIRALCFNIQSHIDYSRKERAQALVFNRKLKRALATGCVTPLLSKTPNKWEIERALSDLALGQFKDVPKSVPQVIVDQVKEKFGTLRFYYHGGDEFINGLVQMAEAMTSCTCERCGNPGTTESLGGWVTTICKPCEEIVQAERKARYGDDE